MTLLALLPLLTLLALHSPLAAGARSGEATTLTLFNDVQAGKRVQEALASREPDAE